MSPLPAGQAPGRDDLAVKITDALDRLGRARRLHRQAVASQHGLTTLQLDLLLLVGVRRPQGPSVGELAREVGVSQPTATDSLHSLERKGLIARSPRGTDRRRRTFVLTPDGAQLIHNHPDRDAQAAIARLDPTQQAVTLEALLGLISRFVDSGLIDVVRTCLTCHFHQTTATGGHRCSLLEADLPPGDLRVDCPEHVPA